MRTFRPTAAHVIGAALALAAAFAVPAGAEDAPAKGVHVPFMEGRAFSQVLATARREGKPILLDVYAVWCNPCKYMDRTTFSDEKVVAWVGTHAVPARIDAEKGDGRRIAHRYAVNSFPTILFLDSAGNEIDRLMGVQPAGEFERLGDQILSGQGPLGLALGALKTQWSLDVAMELVSALGQRNDLARVRPIALRAIDEDPDLSDPRTLGALSVLVAMEDAAGKLTPEVGDLVATYLPRMGADPRRGLYAVALAREMTRQGDAAGLRAHVARVAPTLPRDGYVSDLYATLGEGERKAGRFDAALAAYRQALAVAEEIHVAASVIASRQLDIAETLVAAKKAAEASAAVDKAIAIAPSDPGVRARASTLELSLGRKQEALANARIAVDATKGQDATAQAILARALLASGDAKGAQSAWSRARELEPDNAEYGKPLGAASRKS